MSNNRDRLCGGAERGGRARNAAMERRNSAVEERGGRGRKPPEAAEPRGRMSRGGLIPQAPEALGLKPDASVPRRAGMALEAWTAVTFPRRMPRASADPDDPAPRQMEFRMEIQSTRFGRLTVDDERIITFARGLLGFPDHRKFALIQAGAESYFFWLQSVDDAHLAFVVTDPTIFFRDFEFGLKEEMRQELAVTDPQCLQVFVVCNKVGDWLTGNLQGPLVVNSANRMAQQVVLNEKRWSTRQPLLRLASEAPLAKSA
jgi:flagellar assembly factor FliW